MVAKSISSIYIKLVILGITAIVFSGCASMQAMSSYARSGDTVLIALGGDDSNVIAPVLKKENIVATITDSQSNVFNVTIRSIFKVNADTTSFYNYSTKTSLLSGNYVAAYQGQWLAVIDLVDPVTNSPIPLSSGNAHMSFSSLDLNEVYQYYSTVYNGYLSNVPIEILPGLGTLNPLNYLGPVSESPLAYLEPQPQLLVKPVGSYTPSSGFVLSGAEYVFSFVQASFLQGKPNVTTQIQDSKSQLSVMYTPQSDGTTLMKVLLFNPSGYPADNLTQDRYQRATSPYKAINLSVYWQAAGAEAVDDSNWQNSIQLLGAKYIDTNGNQITSLTPSIQKVR